MAILNNIKKDLRISHDYLNDDIQENIDAAIAEMKRLGIQEEKATDESDPAILRAIKTYCRAMFTDNTSDMEKYFASWQYQIDCLRKTGAYSENQEES